MSLFNRGKRPDFGPLEARDFGNLSFLLEGDPLSSFFRVFCGDSPRDLANFMVARQRRMYGRVIDLPFDALVRHMKQLLKDYSPSMIQRGIVYASWTSEDPFSIRYLKQAIEQVQRCLSSI